MPACDDCGFDAKNAAGLKAHQRKHAAPKPDPEPVPVAAVATEPTPIGPAFLNMNRAGLRVSSVGRSIKMLRAICATCQRGKNYPRDWATRCTHNPYVSRRMVPEKQATYRDEIVDGKATGRKIITGEDTIVSWHPWPNFVQIALRPRVDGATRVARKRALGFIFPAELRSPEFPEGISDICEFRDCFWQHDLINTKFGRYCREVEAQLIGQDLRPGALEVGNRAENREKQQAQLEAVPI